MTPVVIGTAADSLAFSLVGVRSFVCETRSEIDAAVDLVIREFAEPVILLSASAAGQISDRCDQWRRAAVGPMFVALPE